MTVDSSSNEQPVNDQHSFQHVLRYWDEQQSCWMVKLMPGDIYVTQHSEYLSTLLGSCIAVCMRDTELGIGGMNHFMLPQKTAYSSADWGTNPVTYASRYGSWAMEYLINEILKQGGQRHQLELKVFGGGHVLPALSTDIGQRNIDFLYDYVEREGLTIVAADLGEKYSRKIIYCPQTGKVRVKRVHEVEVQKLLADENQYYQQLLSHRRDLTDDNIDLF